MLFKSTRQKKVVKLIGTRLLFISVVFVYGVVGALIIQRIESKQDNHDAGETRSTATRERKNETYPNSEPAEAEEEQWTMASSFLYTFSMLTTIGYGHVSPETLGGRSFSIIYGLIGIPLTMMMLADMGKFVSELLRWIHVRSTKIFRKGYYKFQHLMNYDVIAKPENDQGELEDEESPLFLIILSYILWLLLGGAILPLYEGEMPSISSAIYFSFISISTIGFGDLSPQTSRYANLALTMLYILIGLAIMTMLVECMGEYLRKIHFHGRQMPNLRKTVIWFGGKKMLLDDVIGGVLKEMNIDVEEKKVPNLDHMIQKVLDDDERTQSKQSDILSRSASQEQYNAAFYEENNNSVSATPMSYDPFLPTMVFIDQEGQQTDDDRSSFNAEIPSMDDDDQDVYVEYTLSVQ